MMRYILFSLLITTLVFSKTSFAEHCLPIKTETQGKNIVLGKDSAVYFFKNISKHAIWLNKVNIDSKKGASAGWASFIHSNHWSALATNKNTFVLSCSLMTPNKLDPIDCSSVISVCVPENLKAQGITGSFWITEDKPWDDFVESVVKRKIHFKATTS